MSAADGQRSEREGRARLADISASAHVSLSTVSKVLNGRPGVSAATRERVEELLDEHGYVKRARTSASRPLLDVVCFEIDAPFGAAVLARIERRCAGLGVSMVVTGADQEHLPPAGWSEAVVGRHSRAVILVGAELAPADLRRLRAASTPIVLIDPSGTPEPGVPTIGTADWNGAFQATQHLIDLGHRDIAIITGPDNMMASMARKSGYLAALSNAGLSVDPGWIRPGSFNYQEGVVEAESLLSQPHRPTAIFASSDPQALGVCQAARNLSLMVPADVSVVGYDDLPIAQWAGPPLTTVRVPLSEITERALDMALRLGEKPSAQVPRIDLATSLVVRESTAPPRVTI